MLKRKDYRARKIVGKMSSDIFGLRTEELQEELLQLCIDFLVNTTVKELLEEDSCSFESFTLCYLGEERKTRYYAKKVLIAQNVLDVNPNDVNAMTIRKETSGKLNRIENGSCSKKVVEVQKTQTMKKRKTFSGSSYQKKKDEFVQNLTTLVNQCKTFTTGSENHQKLQKLYADFINDTDVIGNPNSFYLKQLMPHLEHFERNKKNLGHGAVIYYEAQKALKAQQVLNKEPENSHAKEIRLRSCFYLMKNKDKNSMALEAFKHCGVFESKQLHTFWKKYETEMEFHTLFKNSGMKLKDYAKIKFGITA